MNFSNVEDNYLPYAGTGERCLPGDKIDCGDGGKALDAKLQYPKGMAFDTEDTLFFADGTNVRSIDKEGFIRTIIGTNQHRQHWQPLPCTGTVPINKINLRWPLTVAVSPLDHSLHILDDLHILKLTKDRRIKVIAGRSLHCSQEQSNSSSSAIHQLLRSPQSLSFASNGNLYVAESDGERINRIRLITTDGRILAYAGAESQCSCSELFCPCFNNSQILADNVIFSSIPAITVSPNGVVHVLDQGNLRIRSIMSYLPQLNSKRQYKLYSPESQEVYIFNRFGHHVETQNIPTGRTIYSFVYNVNASNGKLSSVTDAAGNRVSFLRDYKGQVTMIENSRQQKCRLVVSRMRLLEHLVIPNQYNVTLDYYGATGLLRSSMDSFGRAHVYTYDKYGRLIRAVTPSGQLIELEFDLSARGARVTITRDGVSAERILIEDTQVTKIIGEYGSFS